MELYRTWKATSSSDLLSDLMSLRAYDVLPYLKQIQRYSITNRVKVVFPNMDSILMVHETTLHKKVIVFPFCQWSFTEHGKRLLPLIYCQISCLSKHMMSYHI